MDQKKYIKKLIDEKKRVKLITRNNDFYEGIITGLTDTCLLLVDRFNNDVMVFLDHIQTIKVSNGEGKK